MSFEVRAGEIVALAGLVAVLSAYAGASSSQGFAPEQPIKFPHPVHVQTLGMNCLYCHYSANKSPDPGLPAMSTCMGCHTIIGPNRPATDSTPARTSTEIQKLQAKYKGKTDQLSRQAMAMEQQALFKEHGTSPFAACLPMLVQMPFFFALFQILSGAGAAAERGEGESDREAVPDAYQELLSDHGLAAAGRLTRECEAADRDGQGLRPRIPTHPRDDRHEHRVRPAEDADDSEERQDGADSRMTEDVAHAAEGVFPTPGATRRKAGAHGRDTHSPQADDHRHIAERIEEEARRGARAACRPRRPTRCRTLPP